jgi:GNAT superfamily N-acetyltransferase
VTDPAIIRSIGELRIRAWRTEITGHCQVNSWLDKWDETALHWAFFLEGVPVAAARMSVHSSIEDVPDAESLNGVFSVAPTAPIASFNRLVVAPPFRGNGLSKKLDKVRVETAEELGCRSIVLGTTSGEKRIKQLISLGFEVVGQGEPYLYSPVAKDHTPTILTLSFPER